MRGVRFTAGERQLLDFLLGPATCTMTLKPLQTKYLLSIRNKLAAANEPGLSVSIQPLEHALIAAAGHKVVPLINGYERASRQAGSLLITVEDMTLVGTWMLNQVWLNGRFTIIDVLNKWSSWYAKAIAERDSRPTLRKGIGNGSQGTEATANTGPDIDRPSPNATNRRPAQGLR